MSIKIEISSAEVKTRSGISARTNKPYSMREQKGYVHLTEKDGTPKRFPVEFKITLGDDQPAYAPGNYTIDDSSFYVDRFDALEIGLILKPLPALSAAKAA